MAKKRVNQGRRVASTVKSEDYYNDPSIQQQIDDRGIDSAKKLKQEVVDIAQSYETIASMQQQITQEADRQYGIEKQLLNNLGVYENKAKLVALQKKLIRDISLEDSNIIKQTVSDYEDYNREAANVAQKTRELLRFRKEQLPYEDKIKGFQQEIAILQEQGVQNLTKANQEKLKDLTTMEKGYQALSKQEQMNKRIEKIQENITDALKMQGTAVGDIFSTLKDIVTNPLVIFTGLLALGVSRYEEMRQRGNQLAEEQDRVNKALAGAGPFQEKILAQARKIKSEFYTAGEGFSSSLEGAVTAVQALEAQMGNIDFVSGKLVNTMSKLKLSIGLSDEESAKVLDTFMIMSNLSEDAAVNASKVTYQMAETVGLNPAAVFQDIASASAETLAHFSGGAQQIAKAAVEARRMGLTLQDVASISKSLLDFETSIEAEMEAQMLTGMELNFNKARMFAMNKQGDKAAEEVMRQVGGLQRFQKMNIFQQEAIAKATGLDLNTLLKSNTVREKENKLARDKNKLVGAQLEMSVEATKMMGKLDAGLTIMQEISRVLGDLFLDVFMPGMKQGERTLLGFIKGDKFKNVVTTILKGVKSVMDAVVSIFRYIGDSTPFKALSNYFGGGNLSASNPGQMDDNASANRIGNAVKIGLGAYGLFKLGTFLKPMFVRVVGGGPGGGGSMFGLGGSPGKFYKGGQFMPGGMRAPAGGMMTGGRTLGGMSLGSGLGGSSGALGTAMGGTMLGTAGAVLGAAGAVGSIGMGIYDVATLGDRATSRDRATAYGGLGGAAGGAAIGAAIGSVVPVVGTLLGAGIGGIVGYFGGRSIGAMDAFRDELDTARDMAKEATEKRSEAMSAAQHRFEVDALKSTVQIGKAFKDLSGGMKELTGKKMKEFGKLLVDSGAMGQEAFAQFAKDGKITMEELARIQSSVSQDIINMGNEQINKAIVTVDEENLEFSEIPQLQSQINLINTALEGNLADTRTRGQLNLDHTDGFFDSYANRFIEHNVTRTQLTEEDINKFLKSRAGAYDLSQEQLSTFLDVYNATQDSEIGIYDQEAQLTNLNKGLTAVLNALATTKETELKNLQAERDNKIIDKFDELNNSGDGINIETSSINAIGDSIPAGQNIYLLQNEDGTNFLLEDYLEQVGHYGLDRARGGILAGGGVLYGPSHAQGGIPTRFGELEGGEAVINKRSTAMYGGLLSQINQSGGGTSFADGGMLGIGPHTAGMKHAGGFIGVLPEALKKFGVVMPEILEETILGGIYKIGEKEATKSGLKSSGFLDNPEDYDKVQKSIGITGKAVDYASYGAMAVKYGAPLANRLVPGLVSTAFSGAAASTASILGPAAWALLLAQIAYTAWKNKHDEAQKELHNHGGLTSNEYGVLERELSGATDLSNPTNIPYSGQTAMIHGLSQDQVVPSMSTYEQFDAHGRPFSQLYRGEHWLPSMPGRDAGYKSDRGNNMFFPDAYIDKMKGNMGAQGSDIQAGLTRTAFLDQMLYMAKRGQAKGVTHGEVSRYATNPEDTTRYHALTATPDLPGYGYKDIYGFGPKTGRTGYALKDNAAFYEFWNYDDMEMTNPESKARGGVLSNSPIKRVNDMILTKDGEMIQTASDDNIIAKKGGITQKSGGGSSRVEALLEGILNAVQESGDTYIDGAKVSAAINSANYRA